MSDFIFKCTSQNCDYVSVKPEKTCPVCSSEVTVALRPLVDESLFLNMAGEEGGDDDEAYYSAMKEAETAESIEAERRYWLQVEEDEKDFEPLEAFESLERFNSLRDMGFDPDSSGDFPY